MVIFSNCKINIGLRVTGKRQDGYHDIETIFFPLPINDVLELKDASETALTTFGLPIPGHPHDNIVWKAYQLLKKDFPELPPVHFYLLKNIPPGAGLGAGSANGAFTLKALNKKYNLGLSESQLRDYALRLGSDCPFFLLNQPAFASGRGENMQPVDLQLDDYQIAVVNPGIHVSTAEAFAMITPQKLQDNWQDHITRPVEEWKDLLENDFEAPIFKTYPEIANVRNELYKVGAAFAMMSGSGSSVYGIFKKDVEIKLSFPKDYYIRITNTRD